MTTKADPEAWRHEWPDEWYADLTPEEQLELAREMGPKERDEWPYIWPFRAHPGQQPPRGDWSLWLIMAGRGFGKTRAGAEWVRHIAETDPSARIALVAATLGEARSVMVEGESGILACCPPHRRPSFEPSLHRLTWPAGAQATLYSAGEPEALRGPQNSHAWCDEVAKWNNAGGKAVASWDNLLLGMRLGALPRVVATTTPRAVRPWPARRKRSSARAFACTGEARSTASTASACSRRRSRQLVVRRRCPPAMVFARMFCLH